MGAKYNMCGTEAASDLRGGFFGEVRCKVGGRAEASAPTEGLQGVRLAGRRGRRPLRSVTRDAVRRDDVGSELSAASGRGSEVSEWPRSKFPASAVRQRRNFGHRNRVIVPYGIVSWGA